MSDETREWQACGESKVLHVIDIAKKPAKWSGARAACGRYPQRNYESWFGLSVDEPDVVRAAQHYQLRFCEDCRASLEATP